MSPNVTCAVSPECHHGPLHRQRDTGGWPRTDTSPHHRRVALQSRWDADEQPKQKEICSHPWRQHHSAMAVLVDASCWILYNLFHYLTLAHVLRLSPLGKTLQVVAAALGRLASSHRLWPGHQEEGSQLANVNVSEPLASVVLNLW